MNMINELNVSQKVGRICIKLDDSNPINEEIVRMMNNKCKNVYDIGVWDYNDSVDNSIHDQIKQLVRQSTVMEFTLSYGDLFGYGDLFNNDDGL